MQSYKYDTAPDSRKGKVPEFTSEKPCSSPPFSYPHRHPAKGTSSRPRISSNTFSGPQSALNAGNASVLEGPPQTPHRASVTWESSNADIDLISKEEEVSNRHQFVYEYNRLAHKYGVRQMVPGDFALVPTNTSASLPDRGGSWISRVIRYHSAEHSAQCGIVSADHRLHPRRSISDIALNFIHLQRKDGLKNKDLRSLVRLCGKSTFYLPADYAPGSLVLPTCFRAMAQFLVQHADTRGIFRVSGSVRVVNALYDYYCADQPGEEVTFTTRNPSLPSHLNCGAHDVASAFKRLLAGLPGGILGSLAVFDALVAIHSQLQRDAEFMRTKETKLRARLIALAILTVQSQYQRELISAVFGLLSLVGRAAETAPREDSNGRPLPTTDLMGYNALGIIFGPLLVGDLISCYHMKLADPACGLVLLPLTPPKPKKKCRSRSRKCKTPKTPRDERAPLTTVDKIRVANEITEMLIMHWREVVRQLRSYDGRQSVHDALSIDHGSRRCELRSSTSDHHFVKRRAPDWSAARTQAQSMDRSSLPAAASPTPFSSTFTTGSKVTHVYLQVKPEHNHSKSQGESNRQAEKLAVKRSRPKPSKSESSHNKLSRVRSSHALSPTVEESPGYGIERVETMPGDEQKAQIPISFKSGKEHELQTKSAADEAELVQSTIHDGQRSQHHIGESQSKRQILLDRSRADLAGDDTDLSEQLLSDTGTIRIGNKSDPPLDSEHREQQAYSSVTPTAELIKDYHRQLELEKSRGHASLKNEQQAASSSAETSRFFRGAEEERDKAQAAGVLKRSGSHKMDSDEDPLSCQHECAQHPVSWEEDYTSQTALVGNSVNALQVRSNENLVPTQVEGPSHPAFWEGGEYANRLSRGEKFPSFHPSVVEPLRTPPEYPGSMVRHPDTSAARVVSQERQVSKRPHSWHYDHQSIPMTSHRDDEASDQESELYSDGPDRKLSSASNWKDFVRVSPASSTTSLREKRMQRGSVRNFVRKSGDSILGSEKPPTPDWKRQLLRKKSDEKKKPTTIAPEKKSMFEKSAEPSTMTRTKSVPTKGKSIGPAQPTTGLRSRDLSQRSTSKPVKGAVKAMAAMFDKATSSVSDDRSTSTIVGRSRSNARDSIYSAAESPPKYNTYTVTPTLTPQRTFDVKQQESMRAPYTTPKHSINRVRGTLTQLPTTPPSPQVTGDSSTKYPTGRAQSGWFSVARKEPVFTESSPSHLAVHEGGSQNIASLGTIVPPHEEPPVAQHLNFARPVSGFEYHDHSSGMHEGSQQRHVQSHFREYSHSPGLWSHIEAPRPGSANSILHAQIRRLQKEVRVRNEEIIQLRRQLEAKSNMDPGILSEQVQEARRECAMWRDRAEAAEKRIAVFERFSAKVRGLKDEPAPPAKGQTGVDGVGRNGSEVKQVRRRRTTGSSSSWSCADLDEDPKVWRDRVRSSIRKNTRFGGDGAKDKEDTCVEDCDQKLWQLVEELLVSGEMATCGDESGAADKEK